MPQFDRIASQYARSSWVQQHLFNQVQSLYPELPGTPCIIDLGCGSGTNTAKLAQRYPKAHSIGYDHSQAMIQHAQAAYPAMSFTSAYATLPQADFISSHGLFHWLDNAAIDAMLSPLCGPHTRGLIHTFGPRTFLEFAQVCRTQGIRLPAQSFRTDYGPAFTPIAQTITHCLFPSVMALLRHMQNTGVTEPWHYQPVAIRRRWTRGFIQQLESVYQALYGGIQVTYQLLSFSYTPSEGS